LLIKDMAKRDAEDVLRTHWDGTFPVDPFSIAESMGIRAGRMQLDDDTSGLIIARQETQSQIWVEARDTEPRQRFTCAHEIGHFVERSQMQRDLTRGFSFVDKRTSKRDAHEFYADEFAGNLLMPERRVRQLDGHMSLIRMAAYFDVSVPAMEVRLRRLDIDLRAAPVREAVAG
jgi:Zn-dependent peptidase ImmA (M78 family)